MPSLIDYEAVQEHMDALGMRSLYYNSGAFGPKDAVSMRYFGWIGPDDPSIRPEALAHSRRVPPPYAQTLAALAARVWQELLPGPAWVMPKSHWAYELDFGSKTWMPGALERLGLDPASLAARTNAAAIEFATSEVEPLAAFVGTLLDNLLGSDFAIAFPSYPINCTIHHHKQLWWVATDDLLIQQIRALPVGDDDRV